MLVFMSVSSIKPLNHICSVFSVSSSDPERSRGRTGERQKKAYLLGALRARMTPSEDAGEPSITGQAEGREIRFIVFSPETEENTIQLALRAAIVAVSL